MYEPQTIHFLVFEHEGNRMVTQYFSYRTGGDSDEDPRNPSGTDLAMEAAQLQIFTGLRSVQGENRWLSLPVKSDNTIDLISYETEVGHSAFRHGRATFQLIGGPEFDAAEAVRKQSSAGLAGPNLSE